MMRMMRRLAESVLSMSRVDPLTDDIPFHQMKPVQMGHRVLGVIRTLVHHISRSFGLEIGVCPEADLADRPVFPEKVVEVRAGDVEVAARVSWVRHRKAGRGKGWQGMIRTGSSRYRGRGSVSIVVKGLGGTHNNAREARGSFGRCMVTTIREGSEGDGVHCVRAVRWKDRAGTSETASDRRAERLRVSLECSHE